MISDIETRDILDTPFYIYHKNGRVYFGLMLHNGTVTSEAILEADYIDWLRNELEKCHASRMPAIFEESK